MELLTIDTPGVREGLARVQVDPRHIEGLYEDFTAKEVSDYLAALLSEHGFFDDVAGPPRDDMVGNSC